MIDSYEKLTLEKFYEIQGMDKEGEDIDVMVRLMAILSDMDENEILNLPINKFNEMAKKVAFLGSAPKKHNNIPNTISINGKKYNILHDASKMTAGQYIDYKTFAKDPDSIEKNLALILTTIIVPDGKTYGDGYDTFELADEFKKYIGIELAVSISNFFFTKSVSYSRNILTYLEWELRKMRRKEKDMETKKKITEAIAKSRSLKSSLKSGFGLIGPLELEKYAESNLKRFTE